MDCSAPDCDNTRIGDSDHCITCKNKYNPIYGKYKHLHQLVKQKLLNDITTLSQYELLSLVSKIEQVYELRSDYRRKAYRTDYWDIGHTNVLDSLLQTLENIRVELHRRFNTPVTEVVEEPEEESAIIDNISIVTATKQSILKQESKEIWPQSQEITNNIKLNTEAQRNIDWLTEKIQSLCSNTEDIYLISFNQYCVSQYVTQYKIKQFAALPASLSGVSKSSYKCISSTDSIAVLKLVYSNLLQHKWLLDSLTDRSITRINNALINGKVYLRMYYHKRKPELTNICLSIVDGKIVLGQTDINDMEIISLLDQMQRDTGHAISSNEQSFVADTINYNKDKQDLFKNGPISIKDLMNMSKADMQEIRRKAMTSRKFK